MERMKMGNIETISIIRREELEESSYLTSLLEKAYVKGLLSEEGVQKIQLNCLELLAAKVERYTGGDSSSIPVKSAENIMKSNLYTIGVFLKTFQRPDEAVRALIDQGITNCYERGRNKIEMKLRAAKHLHQEIVKKLPDINNYTFNATIVDGMLGFFKLYNPDFEAYETHITCDYPLCHPILGLEGIEFIEKYLKSIYYENMFCNYFSADILHHMLCGYNERYEDLIFNIFEQVLTQAMGCVLVKADILSLYISRSQVEQIYTLLSEKSQEEIETIMLECLGRLTYSLCITDLDLKRYMKKSILKVAATIFNAVQIDRLDCLFAEHKYPELSPKIEFSFGEKMDDEKYREVINEISECRFTADKMAIIKREIQSLADLEDLLIDAQLSEEEITEVLNDLSSVEIAALVKRHPVVSKLEMSDLNEKEVLFRVYLNKYMLSLSQEEQNFIMNTVKKLNSD